MTLIIFAFEVMGVIDFVGLCISHIH